MSAAVLPDVRTVYRAPSGRLCRLQRDRGAEGTWRGYWSFTYLDATGQLGDQGFTLTHSNLGILRLADGHGATAR